MQLKTNVTICKINRFIDDEPTQSKWRTLEQQMATNWQLEKDSIAPFHCSFLFLQRNEADWSGGAIDLPDRTSTTNRTTMAKSRRPTIERMIIIFSCFFFLFLFFFLTRRVVAGSTHSSVGASRANGGRRKPTLGGDTNFGAAPFCRFGLLAFFFVCLELSVVAEREPDRRWGSFGHIFCKKSKPRGTTTSIMGVMPPAFASKNRIER